MNSSLQGSSAEKLYEEASQLVTAGEIDQAIGSFRKILDRYPEFAPARNDLGALLFQQGNLAEAKLEIRRAFEAAPNETYAIINYIEVLLATGELQEIYPRIKDLLVKIQHERPDLVMRISEYVRAEAFEPKSFQLKERLKQWDQSIESVTRKVSDTALQYLPAGGVLIDVGANTGLFTEQVLRARQVRAYLFEPVPDYFNYCKEKFRDAPNVAVENLALADSAGRLTLHIDQENLGWNTLESTKCTTGMQPIDIDAITFDRYAEAAGIDRIDVVKIDVEGAEYRVLKGMQKTLLRLKQKPVIICEVGWGPAGHPNWREEVEAFEWLFANGYERCDYNVAGTSDVIFHPAPEKREQSSDSKSPLFTVGILAASQLKFDAEQLGSLKFEIINTTSQIIKSSRSLSTRYVNGSTPIWSVFEDARSEYVLLIPGAESINGVEISRLHELLVLSENVGGALVSTPSGAFIGMFRRSCVLSSDSTPFEVKGIAELAQWLSLRGSVVLVDPFFQLGQNITTFGSSGVMSTLSPVRVLVVYDEVGWAWWHRANHLKKYIDSGVQIDVRQMHERVDYNGYDFIFLFDHNLLDEIHALRSVSPSKIVLGNSCPRYVTEAAEAVRSGKAVAGITNNVRAWRAMKDSSRWFCCPNGVDLELFRPSGKALPQRVACWTGHSKSVGNKGLDLIREACKQAGYELKVVDAHERKSGESALSQEQLRDRLYHQAGVLICASEFEGTPNPALEALACGMPVISTSVGNMPEILIDGFNGWLVSRDVSAITAALQAHAQADLAQLSQNARSSVENGWSWHSQVRKYADIFQQLRIESSADRVH